MRTTLCIALLVLNAAACTRESEPRIERGNDTPASASTAPQPAAAVAAPPADAVQPAATVPAPAPVSGPMPAAGTIGFDGFGPAKFGATAEEVRMAWGKDMRGKADQPGGCYYLQPLPEGPVAFMIESDRFVRIDVDAASVTAPGGGQVGMSTAEIRKRYPAVEELPHKYSDKGRYLRVKDPGAGKGVLVFETGESGEVLQWRIGTPPQVDYVEGCS